MTDKTRDTEPVAGALSCPFCGSDGEERTYVENVGAELFIRHQIRCRGCGAGTRWFASGRDALKAWSSRHHPLDHLSWDNLPKAKPGPQFWNTEECDTDSAVSNEDATMTDNLTGGADDE